MSKLQELINELCPNGVEYKKLKELIIQNPKSKIGSKKAKNFKKGKYPFYTSGKETYYTNEFFISGENIFVNDGGSADIKYYNGRSAYADHVISFKVQEKINGRFLYHYLIKCKEYINEKMFRGSGIKNIQKSKFFNMLIPVPPMEVQCEIVRILDNFTLLTAELTAELTARKKQYEYYRSNLLIFNKGPSFIKLKDLFNIKNGYTPSKSNKEYWKDGTISWYRMKDIRENGRVLFNSIQKVNEQGVKGNLFAKNSIIISTSATIGEHALITENFLCNQRFTCLTLKDCYKDKFDIKFLFYYCYLLSEWCLNNLKKGSFASVDMKLFNKFKFPMIGIEKQKIIANILDRFDVLCNDISVGLPAEIEKRQKQYEYYRDKLLSFKEFEENE